MKKLNNKGISELIIALIVVVIGVAAFGTYKLVSSSASKAIAPSRVSGTSSFKGSRTILSLRVENGLKDTKSATIGSKKGHRHQAGGPSDVSYNVNVSGHHKNEGRIVKIYNKKGKLVYKAKVNFRYRSW